MCIIAIKKSGQAAINQETLKACWQSNPDGAGFVIHRPNTNKLLIRKGFMAFKALVAALETANIKEADTVIYHFRIATSGGINAANCHPFPISKASKDVKALEIECTKAFVHNGIIGKGSPYYSDTQLYILNTLCRIKNIRKNLKKIARDTTGSRTVILESNGNMYLTGAWVEDGEYLFSNKSHQYSFFLESIHGGFYDDDDDFPMDGICPECGTDTALVPFGGETTLFCPECGQEYKQCADCGQWCKSDDIAPIEDERGNYWDTCWECIAYEMEDMKDDQQRYGTNSDDGPHTQLHHR